MIKHRKLLNFLLAAVHVFVYVPLLAVYFLLLSVTNPQVLRISRTAAIMLTSFSMMLYVFMRIYGGFRIGQQKDRPIVYQMTLSTLLTDVITYIQLQIMNVNEQNNDHLELFSVDLLLVLAAFILQFIFIVVFTHFGNYLFFKAHKPKHCCIITASENDNALICEKIGIFDKQFDIRDCIDYRSENLQQKIRDNQTIVLFHLPPKAHQELIELCYKCRKDILYDMSIADILAKNAGSFLLDDELLAVHARNGLTIRERFFKRIMDFTFSLVGLVLLSPVMAIIAIAIKLDDGGPVFFNQKRLTINDSLFSIYKFRTMRYDKDAREYSLVKDDKRVTRVGAILRKARLDELPQLINIIKGDMSIVGPRPEMISNFNKYITELPEYSYRCRVKAGLTGYAQILGKYNTKPREKLMMDISYIENYSFWLDIKLILKTLTVFFKRDSTEAFSSDPSRDDGEAV